MAQARTSGARKDTWLVGATLTDAGVSIDLGIFDTKTGGDADSDDVTYYPGGMQPMVTLGGKKTTANVVLQRLYDRVADGALGNKLIAATGRGAMSVTQFAMDDNGNEFAPGWTWIGKLKRVLIPDVDSNSTDAAIMELEVTITGSPVGL
jgi:hypothetical protein